MLYDIDFKITDYWLRTTTDDYDKTLILFCEPTDRQGIGKLFELYACLNYGANWNTITEFENKYGTAVASMELQIEYPVATSGKGSRVFNPENAMALLGVLTDYDEVIGLIPFPIPDDLSRKMLKQYEQNFRN